jgi:hypothetical protein
MWKVEEGGALQTWQPGAKNTIPGIDNMWIVRSKIVRKKEWHRQ